jgi:hypothetical protein
MANDKPLREQLVAAREAAKKSGVPLRERLGVLLRGHPANVTRHILRAHGADKSA